MSKLRATGTPLGQRVQLLAEAATVESVDQARRTITGLVVPYGVGGRTNLGRGVSLRAGAVRFHRPDAPVVIGLYGHDRDRTVSRMVAQEDRANGWAARFRVAATPLGDQLLAEADPEVGVRSALSIELDEVLLDEWTGEITSGLCEFVAHVPIGAYDDALVTSVTASAHNPNGDTVPRRHPLSFRPTREFIEVHGGGQPAAVPAPAPAAQPAAVPAPAPAPAAPAPQLQLQAQPGQQAPAGIDWASIAAFAQAQGLAATAPPAAPAGHAAPQPAVTQGDPAQLQAQAQGQSGPAFIPGGLSTAAIPAAPRTDPAGPPRRDAIEHMAQLQAQAIRNPHNAQLRAALADVTNSGLDLFQSPAGAIGEQLWQGVGYSRRFVQLMRQKALTSWKFTSWQWVNTPKVAAYAGDKAQIPTNTVSVEAFEHEATRVAGGWDVDRKFRDFGDAAFWAGFYEAQTESYLEVTDLQAAAAIVAFARDVTVDGNVPASYVGMNNPADGILKACALGTAIMEDTPKVRRGPDYVLVNTQDWLTLMDLTNFDLPAFLALLKVHPDNFMRTQEVAQGSVVMGVTPAMTFRELGGGSPIRVEALNVAQAGVDSAVYGYTGISGDRPGGVISVPLAAPAGP
jgi:hypothetical protein